MIKSYSTDRDLKIEKTTISVWLKNGGPYVKKLFRCVGCGLPVLEYFSDVKIIFLGGETPNPQNPDKVYKCSVVVRCKRCKQEYKFE
tara:strand:- start:2140 stop:2400 length:261 start_codon:yes stop_codon:yes gene_type:complete